MPVALKARTGPLLKKLLPSLTKSRHYGFTDEELDFIPTA